MSTNRRHFLVNTGLTIAAAALSARGQDSSRPSFAPGKPDTNNLNSSWAAVREQFDSLSRDYIHLSSSFLVSHPRPVREAIEKHRRAIDDNPLLKIISKACSRLEITLRRSLRESCSEPFKHTGGNRNNASTYSRFVLKRLQVLQIGVCWVN